DTAGLGVMTSQTTGRYLNAFFDTRSGLIGHDQRDVERLNYATKRVKRLSRVDGGTKERSAVDALRKVGRQRADLVDDPAVVRNRTGFVDSLVEQQFDVVKQETSAILGRHQVRGTSGRQVRRLRQD